MTQENLWLGLHWLDWIILIAYLIGVTAIGVWSYKKVKNMSDYFMGGRRFGKVFMMFFAFGAGTSSEQAIGVVAGTWRAGLAGIWWQFLWLWATPFYWIVAPVMRRMRALTTADFFEARFNASTAALYTVYGIIMSIVFIAAGLYGSGKMVNALTGGELDRVSVAADLHVPSVKWDDQTRSVVVESRRVQGYEFAILAMTVIFLIYGMAGGLGAAIITDLIQGVLTITFSFLLLPFVFGMIGGFGHLQDEGELKQGMFEFFASGEAAVSLGKEEITIFYVFMLSITALIGIIAQPHIMGVCGAGKSEFEGRFGFTFGNFMKRFCTIAWTFTGLACIVWYLGSSSLLKNSENPADLELYTTLKQRAEFNGFKATVLAKELSPEDAQRVQQRKEQIGALPIKEREQAMGEELKRLRTKLKALPEGTTEQIERKKHIEKVLTDESKRVDDTDKKFSDELFGRAAYDILPTVMPGLVGLLIASLLAAVMSTSDAQMVISSGLFTENIYRRFLVRDKSQRHYLWVGRLSGLVIVALALVLQSTFTDVIDALKIIIKTPAAIGISLWFAIVWRRWTTAAVWISTLTAASVWAFVAYRPDLALWLGCPDFMFHFDNVTGELSKMGDAWQNFCYLFAGVFSGVVASLLTKPPSKEKLDDFYALLHTPIKPDEIIEKPCTLPEDPMPQTKKLFKFPDIELPKPTFIGLGGFILAWILVALIIWLTNYLSTAL